MGRNEEQTPASAASPDTVRIGLVQMRCGEDAEDNLARALAGLDEAA